MKKIFLFLFLLVGLTNSLIAGGDDRDLELIDTLNNQPQVLLSDEELLPPTEIEKIDEKQATALIPLKTQSDQANQEITSVSETNDAVNNETPYQSEPVDEEPTEIFNDDSDLESKEDVAQPTITISKEEVADTKLTQFELIALLIFSFFAIGTIYIARRNSTLSKRGRS